MSELKDNYGRDVTIGGGMTFGTIAQRSVALIDNLTAELGAANRALNEARAQNERLWAALAGVVEMHCDLVNSGDCGFWNPEDTPEIKRAREALAERPK